MPNNDFLTERMLDADEVAERLNVSRATAYRLMGTQIPALRFGRVVRVRQSDLRTFIETNVQISE
jgi:excisionase family DNA binding protein